MNANFDAVEAALENTLSRDGTSPNQMAAVIDMNSNKIINLAAPTSGSDAARLTDVLAVAPGTGVNTFLVTPSSANLAAALTDETGTGLAVFNTSPTLVTPILGTPASVTLTNGTGLPVSGITASTSTALGVGSLELGHASDTTLARTSAGDVTIEGNLVYRAGGTDVPVADGGTGASTAGGALTNLGVSAFNQTLLGTANQAAFLAAFGQIDNVETDFVQAGTGAVTITTQAKLRQASVQPNSGEFGAFTTPTISTATLLAAFTHAMAAGRVVELAGAYTIDGPITPTTAVDGAELRIFLRDDVTITVDSGATAFDKVFYAESTTPVSHAISGNGSLTLDCNNKAAVGIWLRHTASTTGGSVAINNHVHIKNLTAKTGLTNATGISVYGRYDRIVMRSPTVENVTRVDVSGECSGITCSDFDGEVELYAPVVRNVYYGPGTADADGIKCFGRQSGASYDRREGSVRIYDPIIENCQVRLYKDQCGNTIIYNPRGLRRAVDGTAGTFAASSSVDFDFQFGGGLVLNAHLEYYKSATNVSPLGSSHSVFAFQQLIQNSEMFALAKDTVVITDVEIPRVALSATSSAAEAFTTEIDGLTILPVSGFTATAVGRGIVEFDSSQVGVKPTATNLIVRNTRAPNTWPVIAYTGNTALVSGTATAGAATTLTDSGKSWTTDAYAGYLVRITAGTGAGQIRTIASNTGTVLTVGVAWTTNPDATSVYSIWYEFGTKLSVTVDRCETTLPPAGNQSQAFKEISGSQISDPKWCMIGDNPGYRNFYFQKVCLKHMRAGSKLILHLDDAETKFVDTDLNTAVSVPWGTTGYIYLECKAGLSNYGTAANDTVIEARLNNATASPSAWFTQYGGVQWGALN